METCDVLIVGGGPAGSTCAWKLAQAGADVMVMDAATFPRDKVCAGWITPQVVADLALNLAEYAPGRTLQPITAFRTGVIGDSADIETRFGTPVSYGIRRCEFDHYLLERSRARLKVGSPLSAVRRDGDDWIVNETVRTPMLVGAGGHFCPVARRLNPAPGPLAAPPVVAAQEAEFPIEPHQAASFTTAPEMPELYFAPDLKGYGWSFRKQGYVNIGFGSLDRRSLPKATAHFVSYLAARGTVPSGASWRWRGHAYLLQDLPNRRLVDDGVLLVGDAVGLAYPQSGEGIRPAIESGLLAAATLLAAGGRYGRERLEPYVNGLRARFGVAGPLARALPHVLPADVMAPLGRRLLRAPLFVRHVVLNRWFLHAHQPPVVH